MAEFDVNALTKLGFKKLTNEQWVAKSEEFAKSGMNLGGKYDFLYLLTRNATTVLIEQNTATVIQDGLEVTTKHPPVAILSGPGGRAAVAAGDMQALLTVLGEIDPSIRGVS